jgi:hypothetical protein
MLAALILAVAGIAFAGLVLFVAMCAAIRNDDKEGLPSQPPTLRAALTRRVLGMTRSRAASPRHVGREPCLTGTVAGPGDRPGQEGR